MVNLTDMHECFKVLCIDLNDLVVERKCLFEFLLLHLQFAEHKISFFMIFVDIEAFL